MNEFEWLQQLRQLERPVEPARDLWPDIRVAITAPRTAREPHPAWSIAAAVALAVIGLFGMRAGLHDVRPRPDVATQAWQPNDPRLAAAAISLDAAHAELADALRSDPRSDSLQRLLERTERKRDYLRNLDHSAG